MYKRQAVLTLAGTSRDLAVLAERAARHDPATPVRLVASRSVLAAFVTTPFECLGMRATRLAEPVSADLDVVVEAVGLAARARGAQDGTLRLPPRLPDITWAQPLPPRGGWRDEARVPASQLATQVAADSEDFRLQATQVAAGRGAAAALERVAEGLWSAAMVGDAPARLAHAADYLGFVPETGEAVLRAAGAWRRLDTALGVTVARVSDPLGLFVR